MSHALCELARRSLRAQAEIRCGSLEEPIPYPDHTFDLVLLTEVVEHLSCPEVALGEVVRVAKPSGRIVITMPNGSAYQPFAGPAQRRGGRGLWVAFLPWEHPVKTRQPIDTVYSYDEIHALLAGSGLVIERIHGREAFPYVWDCMYFGKGGLVGRVFGALDRLRPAADGLLNRLGVRRLCYRLFIACRRGREGDG
jgi:SAM-dependent methyltransferase